MQADLGDTPPKDWKRIVTTEGMTSLLDKVKTIVTTPGELQSYPALADYLETFTAAIGVRDQAEVLQAFFDKEARVTGYVIFLAQHTPNQLRSYSLKSP